ncbi:hypothetical protein IL59_0213785 [Brucella suis bv. 4 str. 40]|nr:hypothetical protein BKD02_03255 [Brucella sp. 09RB8910]KEY03885.1 hypothetical protein IL59_0213785 [Brucella suis bv. 4 str. 40]
MLFLFRHPKKAMLGVPFRTEGAVVLWEPPQICPAKVRPDFAPDDATKQRVGAVLPIVLKQEALQGTEKDRALCG